MFRDWKLSKLGVKKDSGYKIMFLKYECKYENSCLIFFQILKQICLPPPILRAVYTFFMWISTR